LNAIVSATNTLPIGTVNIFGINIKITTSKWIWLTRRTGIGTRDAKNIAFPQAILARAALFGVSTTFNTRAASLTKVAGHGWVGTIAGTKGEGWFFWTCWFSLNDTSRFGCYKKENDDRVSLHPQQDRTLNGSKGA
jgi:hypothetical protein